MNKDVELCLKILDDAIQFEEEGFRFFQDREKNAPSDMERRIFHSLAKDEAGHKEYLVAMKEKLVSTKDISAIQPDTDDVHRSAREIFAESLSQAKKAAAYDRSELEILDGALEVERRGYRMYSNAANSVESPQAKETFLHLAQQEQEHYQLLRNALDYLADPEGFNSFHEGPILDGG